MLKPNQEYLQSFFKVELERADLLKSVAVYFTEVLVGFVVNFTELFLSLIETCFEPIERSSSTKKHFLIFPEKFPTCSQLSLFFILFYFIYLFIYSFIYLLIYLFIYLFTYLFIYLSIYLFIYLFIYLLIYLFFCWVGLVESWNYSFR